MVIFTDGASLGNPGPGGWGAILSFVDGQIREIGGSASEVTNNQMEMTAALMALKEAQSFIGKITLYTDSTYLIKGMTRWMVNWESNGWKTLEGKPVANAPLWQELARVCQDLKISWKHLPGHAGIPANERVDEIATSLAKGKYVKLYSGPKTGYKVSLADLKPKRDPKAPAIGYLSLVSGTPKRHTSWAECEQRVRGASSAKYKKYATLEEANEILRGWGFDPSEV